MTLSAAVVRAAVAAGVTVEQLAAIILADIEGDGYAVTHLPAAPVAVTVAPDNPDPDKIVRVNPQASGKPLRRPPSVVETMPPEGAKYIALKAISASKLTGNDKTVANRLIEHFNVATRRCDPSTSRIARGIGLDVRVVRRSISALVSAGLFGKAQHGGHHRTNRYVPNWPLMVEIATRTEQSADPDKVVHQNLRSKPQNLDQVRGNSARGRQPDRRQMPLLLPIVNHSPPAIPSRAAAAHESAKKRVSEAVYEHLLGQGGRPHFASVLPTIPQDVWDAAYQTDLQRRGQGAAVVISHLQRRGPPLQQRARS